MYVCMYVCMYIVPLKLTMIQVCIVSPSSMKNTLVCSHWRIYRSVQGRCSGTVRLSSVQPSHIERSGAGNDRGHPVACDTSRIDKRRGPAQLNISEWHWNVGQIAQTWWNSCAKHKCFRTLTHISKPSKQADWSVNQSTEAGFNLSMWSMLSTAHSGTDATNTNFQ